MANQKTRLAKQSSAYILNWNLSSIKNNNYDAELIKFDGWREFLRLCTNEHQLLPDTVTFETNFNVLSKTDFPYNDVGWPIMSKYMLDSLRSIRYFPIKEIKTLMLDHSISKHDHKFSAREEIVNESFISVYLIEKLDVFDRSRSLYECDSDFPEDIIWINKLVLKDIDTGYPPLFRIPEYPTLLFISYEARIALETCRVQGVQFDNIEDFQG